MAHHREPKPERDGPKDASGDVRPWLPYARQWIDEADIEAVAAVLRSPLVTQGPALARFERALEQTTGAKHAIAVSSGSAALHLCCLACDLGPGQTGLTSPITFAASANGFLYAGARAGFVDVDPDSGLMSIPALEAEIESRFRAGAPPGVVVAVSLGGRPPDLPAMQAVCDRRGWILIEDAAHSLGATYGPNGDEYQSGSCVHSRAAILSFHPVKHVCAGEGGAVLTGDDAFAARVRRLRSHGVRRPDPADAASGEGGWFYEQVELGFHYRMTEMQAALGTSQLAKLPGFLSRRRALARRYAEALSQSPFDRVLRSPGFDSSSAYHLYAVRFHDARLRRRAYDVLARNGVGTQVHYIPVYRHPCYREREKYEPLAGAERYYDGCLSLPLFPAMSEADQEHVIDVLADFSRHGGR